MLRSATLRFSLALILGTISFAACSSNDDSAGRGRLGNDSGGNGGTADTGGSGSASSSATASGPTSAGDSGGADTAGIVGGGNINYDASSMADAPAACQQADVNFIPQIPTVFLLVDRSGSMFSGATSNPPTDKWTPLKNGILSVVQNLQADIRFGFGAFAGEQPEGPTCPQFDHIAPALNNYDMINTLYNGLKAPTKGETPTAEVLRKTRDLLMADNDPTATGKKSILFVTDGEPDFCDDGEPICPQDAVVQALQEINSQGFETFIFGLPYDRNNDAMGLADFTAALQAWANAGAGQPVGALSEGGKPVTNTDIWDRCQGVMPWQALFNGAWPTPRGTTLGMYSATGGTTTVYKPDPTNQQALTDELAKALKTVKSCTFDLAGQIKVDLPKASRGHVTIDDMSIPFDATNGWQMVTETELELEGTACQNWRNTGTHIHFDFPCEIIIHVM